MKTGLKKAAAVFAAITMAASGFTGFSTSFAANGNVTLSGNLAVCGEPATAAVSGITSPSYQWYTSATAAADGEAISGATESAYIPGTGDLKAWLYCKVSDMDGTEITSDKIRVVGSKTAQMEEAYTVSGPESTSQYPHFIGNTTNASGKIDPGSWTCGGYLYVEYTGISYTDELKEILQLRMNTWSSTTGKKPQNVAASEVSAMRDDGTIYAKYMYEDMLSAWNGDKDFSDLKALLISYTGNDKAALVIKSAKYVGPTFEYTAPAAAEAKLSDKLAIYQQEISVTVDNMSPTSYQWYTCTTAAGANPAAIGGATGNTYEPSIEEVGAWLYCEAKDSQSTAVSNKVRIAASMEEQEIPYPVGNAKIENYHLALLSNTSTNSGKIDVSKWAHNGYIYIEFKGINDIPKLNLGTWSVEGKTSQNVTAFESGSAGSGNQYAKYSYEDMLESWYSDADFTDLKALRIYYDGSDEADLEIVSAKYAGPALSYGTMGEQVDMRGRYSSYQFQFTRHVGGGFDATRLREDSYFYVEYQGDADALDFVAQSHSDGNTEDGSTYATVHPSETGKTGTGYYSKFTAEDIKKVFGEQFRYIDAIRLAPKSGKKLTADAAVYLFEGNGELVDDIAADGYDDAVEVPWIKYDDTGKDGIVVIGASISQNPLVTPLALSGEPFYAAQGGWNAMLDRTDVVTYGIGSQTTDDIATRFDEVLRYDYKKIIIQCGNNDLGNYSTGEAAGAAELANYRIMMDKVAEKSEEIGRKIPVYIISLNPVNSEATNKKIPAVIKTLKGLEDEYDFVTYVDVYDEFKDPESPIGASYKDLVMSDGLHPVAKGYAIYAEHLKPLLASQDESDASLISLSWRASTEERKNVVTGFESGTSGEQEYQVDLPASVASDATVSLYVTANNLSSEVTVSDGLEIMTDDYGNSYIPMTLVNGSRSVTITVESKDGSQTSSYKVQFGAGEGESIYEAEEDLFLTVTDDNAGSWPYVELTPSYSAGSSQTSYLEFDIEVENQDFEKLYLESDISWNQIEGSESSYASSKFKDNMIHVSMPFTGNAPTIQIKTGEAGSGYSYRGTIYIKNLKITVTPGE